MRSPVLVLVPALASLIVFGLGPAVRIYQIGSRERLSIQNKAREAARVQVWMRSHPEAREVSGPLLGVGEAGLITFLQEGVLRSGVRLGSVRPVISGSRINTAQQERYRVVVLGREGELRRLLLFLEEARTPWRVGDVEIRGGNGGGAGVRASLVLEKAEDADLSREQLERLLTQENIIMKGEASVPTFRRSFFAASRSVVPAQESPLVLLSKGWDLVGILSGVDPKAVIEDVPERRVFSVRTGDVVGGATVTAIGVDSVVFKMGDGSLCLAFK